MKWQHYVAEHLQHCPECRADHLIRQRLHAELPMLAVSEVPEDLLVGLHRRLALVSPMPRHRWRAVAMPMAAAVAGFLVAVAVIAPFTPSGRVPSQTSAMAETVTSHRPTVAASAATLQQLAPAAIHPNALSEGASITASPKAARATVAAPVLTSITLLTAAPSQAVGTLSVDVAALGGTVVAQWLPEMDTPGISSAATLTIALPAQAETTLVGEADHVGRVVASAGSSSTATTEQSVTVVVTVLGSTPSSGGVSRSRMERFLRALGTRERRWLRGI